MGKLGIFEITFRIGCLIAHEISTLKEPPPSWWWRGFDEWIRKKLYIDSTIGKKCQRCGERIQHFSSHLLRVGYRESSRTRLSRFPSHIGQYSGIFPWNRVNPLNPLLLSFCQRPRICDGKEWRTALLLYIVPISKFPCLEHLSSFSTPYSPWYLLINPSTSLLNPCLTNIQKNCECWDFVGCQTWVVYLI